MSREQGLVDVLNDLVDYRLLTVNTAIPARVTSIDYQNNNLNAKPLITTRYSDEEQEEYPELFNIPFLIISGNAGTARITMPLKVGDTVLVMFSQRDLQGFYQSDGKTVVKSFKGVTHGLDPVLAVPCLYTNRSSKPIDPNNVVVENGSTRITMEPSGNVTVDTPNSVFTGNVDIQGDLNVAGDTSIGGSVTNNDVNIGEDHTHSGVQSGGDNSGPPLPPSP